VGWPLPTADEEAMDPDGADGAYDEAAATLRELSRDPARFALLHKENTSYGFRRNLLGLRPWGRAIACVTLVAAAITGLVSNASASSRISAAIVPGVWSILALAMYARVVKPAWVESAANEYARRLLGAVELLVRDGSSQRG
ncbi:MAG TPA: hypothetical protein VGF74_05700, partial [Thermoleophilaceae bacterium]